MKVRCQVKVDCFHSNIIPSISILSYKLPMLYCSSPTLVTFKSPGCVSSKKKKKKSSPHPNTQTPNSKLNLKSNAWLLASFHETLPISNSASPPGLVSSLAPNNLDFYLCASPNRANRNLVFPLMRKKGIYVFDIARSLWKSLPFFFTKLLNKLLLNYFLLLLRVNKEFNFR